MKDFIFLLLVLFLGSAAASRGADCTITWHPWRTWGEVRVRTGDRYLGGERWEHYLGFELFRPSTKKIKISMISLGGEPVHGVVIAPGRRYGIIKITNSAMTAHKGRWSWTAEEVRATPSFSHIGLVE
jgi:hypothetical protein